MTHIKTDKQTANALTVTGLVKKYDDITAVDNLSFSVDQGSVFAFLGTNGAGKSTSIGCITTILDYNAGEIKVNDGIVGKDNQLIRRDIGVVFQSSLLDPMLTVKENLISRSSFYSMDKKQRDKSISNLVDLIGLESFYNQKYGVLSGGQRRRVDIARSLLHSPSILFLDEPTAGLDPKSRRQVWDTIHSLRINHGLTVFLTTHYMEETEEANMVLVIEKGKKIAEGTPIELKTRYSKNILTIKPHSLNEFINECQKKGYNFSHLNDTVTILLDSSNDAFNLLQKERSIIKDFEFRHGTMDDVFLNLTNTGVSK